jgi:hypothetical protein
MIKIYPLVYSPCGVDVDGVVGSKGVASVGVAVVGHQTGGPVHGPQIKSSLQRNNSQ